MLAMQRSGRAGDLRQPMRRESVRSRVGRCENSRAAAEPFEDDERNGRGRAPAPAFRFDEGHASIQLRAKSKFNLRYKRNYWFYVKYDNLSGLV